MIDDAMYEVHPDIAQALPQQPVIAEEPQEVIEQPQEAQPQTQPQPHPSVESREEINWRVAREKEKRLQQERDDAIRLAQELQQKYAQPKEQQAQEADEINIGNDDIVEGKHLSKVQKELRRIKEEFSAYKQQNTNYTAETRLKAQFPDFDKVVNKENIETLQYAYPELYNTLSASTDLYNTGVSAYTLIKKFNISETHNADGERAQKNISKPKPTNAISPQQGDNPLTRANAFANGLTEDVKKQMFKEMNEARKGY